MSRYAMTGSQKLQAMRWMDELKDVDGIINMSQEQMKDSLVKKLGLHKRPSNTVMMSLCDAVGCKFKGNDKPRPMEIVWDRINEMQMQIDVLTARMDKWEE